MTKPTYDTQEGIQAYLGELPMFNVLIHERHRAHYDRKEILDEWIVCGRWRLDACGNTMVITDGSPLACHRELFEGKVLPWEAATTRSDIIVCSMGANWPTASPVATCARCGEGWTMRNAHDFKYWESYQDEPAMWLHVECHRFEKYERALEAYQGVFKKAEWGEVVFKAIPNQYWKDGLEEPWFLVDTTLGVLQVGRRKRVYELRWEKTELDATGLFEQENTTKGPDMIHAWNEEDLVRYLTALGGAPMRKRAT